MKSKRTQSLVQISMFSAFLILCSWISIPGAVPFTMQTFGIFLTATVLGTKNGSIAVLIYIVLGAVGLPVFSGGRAGLEAIFGQTGGYIIGFLPGSYLCGLICERTKKRPSTYLAAMLVGLLCVYISGSIWFSQVYFAEKGIKGFWTAIVTCVLPFVIPDVVKLSVAAIIAKRISKLIR